MTHLARFCQSEINKPAWCIQAVSAEARANGFWEVIGAQSKLGGVYTPTLRLGCAYSIQGRGKARVMPGLNVKKYDTCSKNDSNVKVSVSKRNDMPMLSPHLKRHLLITGIQLRTSYHTGFPK